MTQQVRKAYKGRRKWAWIVVLPVLTAAALAVVIPAVAAEGDDIPPRSTPGNVLPVENSAGGNTFTCASVNAEATNEFKISNPKSGPYTATTSDGQTVTFDIKVSTGKNKDKYLSFLVTDGAVSNVAINGGSNTAVYTYDTWATTDGDGSADATLSAPVIPSGAGPSGLHATKDNSGNLYSLSYTTFCYEAVGTIDGTVYFDTNESGSLSQPPDWGVEGAIVRLYSDSGDLLDDNSPDGTGSNGAYTFENVPLGQDYVLCVTPPAGSWTQTEPDPAGTQCSSPLSGLDAGHAFTFDASPATKDFGLLSTVAPSCDEPFSTLDFSTGDGDVEYEARLITSGECKADPLVMYSYSDGANGLLLNLHPTNTVNCAAVPRPATCYDVLEHIVWTGIDRDSQNPVTLYYDDVPPYDGVDKRLMLPCDSNTLTGPWTLSANPVMPGDHTSCLLESTDSAGAGVDDRSYEAWIFSSVDGYRFSG
jgi:hypothetical protein